MLVGSIWVANKTKASAPIYLGFALGPKRECPKWLQYYRQPWGQLAEGFLLASLGSRSSHASPVFGARLKTARARARAGGGGVQSADGQSTRMAHVCIGGPVVSLREPFFGEGIRSNSATQGGSDHSFLPDLDFHHCFRELCGFNFA